MKKNIFIKGARVHNLKNVDVEIPRNKFCVITGISGSGKSSLAFDTIYAEGQRRYVESLSAYARQFLGTMEKPDVDYIEGLSPAISIQQRTASKNPRSTVATVTEIYDYLRLLFARVGTPHCYRCGKRLEKQTVDQIVDGVLKSPAESRIQILAPVVRGRKGEHRELYQKLKRRGYVRCRVDGELVDLDNPPELDRYKIHTIEAVVDRLIVRPKIRKRLADSVEIALREGEGIVLVGMVNGEDLLFSEKLACTTCGVSYEDISPRMFSFNSPYGACAACSGLGVKMEIDPSLLIVSPELSVLEGAIGAWGEPSAYLLGQLESLARKRRFDLDTPFVELPPEAQDAILYGDDENHFEGAIPNLTRRYRETESDWIRYEIEKYMAIHPCPECGGARLKKESLAVKIADLSIHDFVKKSIVEANGFLDSLKFGKREEVIAERIVKEIKQRLGFLIGVGVDYLTLDRRSDTLAGGEEQRVRLATQIGSGLVGVLYILDEPSVGLHQRDNRRLLSTLHALRDLGNTVLVVEHDKQTILSSDWVIDLGPGAGELGGKVIATGTPEQIARCTDSLTGDYLGGRKRIELPKKRRKSRGDELVIVGARENNLKGIDVHIPLGLFICITGVSGSGKSTIMTDILYRALAEKLYMSRVLPGKHDKITGCQHIDKVINIDQSPIGRTPRSNPATYTGVFTYIRELFSMLPEAKIRGYRPGRFSFNVRGGRCEACQGEGLLKIEMHFLPDLYVKCEVCKGKRYNRESLEIVYKGKTIADVLDMTVDEAMELFKPIPKICRKLRLLTDVGLGYIKLGQPAPTLSGGEAQRVKLAKELSKVATGRTLYMLDEPTTGLHFEDVKLLLQVLNKLVDKGNSVVVIEHHVDVIKSADHIIDLGPGGGDEGGRVVCEGTPEEVARCKSSHTGLFLQKELTRQHQSGRSSAKC
ncbi:excinuclease ABC subunit A [candidate division TA06 bacterium DG_26]|uniref:UvrABC system protein A n=1 Tax=candidate division TA06 bacterium DG_26 TaxID=1703771 RepID=A0A0S7WLU3_UNCT6|nr:MAG: excinuclease ABC subunit A [candidate division TA06 bacterium DG_26]